METYKCIFQNEEKNKVTNPKKITLFSAGEYIVWSLSPAQKE